MKNHIDSYLRALEADKLDEYYERKEHPCRKLLKTNKGRWNDSGQAKATGRTGTKKHG